ncbi:hypothetical protein [Streptomyces otsuchiensis]|uniref:hypothetical protein n=1 Tax=Streptomyces otsuchiensis TaxID=2681388 RepID=UPI0010326AC2|nr:hypothetical protein [Streptomyces otsuchiensis]
MGTDGERLVLDYLSKVGDLAHSTSMSAVERRELVGRLRDEIGRQRSSVTGQERDADVKRILRTMGRPEDVVAAAGGPSDGGGTATAGAEVPSGGRAAEAGRAAPAGHAEAVPAARPAPEDLIDMSKPDPPTAGERDAPAAWRDGPIGGFVGGILEPDMLRPPAEPDDRVAPPPAVPLEKAGDGAATDGDAGAPAGERKDATGAAAPVTTGGAAAKPAGTRRWRAVRGRFGGRHAGGPVELAAALLLVAGSVMAELLPMLAGWLLAYWAPRLSRAVAKWAVFGMPGLVVGGYVTWLFGRVNEYWGEPLEGEVMRTAMADNWPMLLRVAAAATAAFLLWRTLRRPPSGV